MKNDKYRHVRDGKATMYRIHCAKCNELVLHYQKDGDGNLLRCYLNRIYWPERYESLQRDPLIKTPKDMPNLCCPACNTIIGLPIRHIDKRLAYKMIRGLYFKKVGEIE